MKKALGNLEDEASYIAFADPKAADNLSNAIFAIEDNLSQLPAMGY
ncbi:type II toxin-antitoxin system RelE/ParE family toxin [Pseudomonas edaphica]|uniref:Type II toxin-antitoxin system RelE/ParE family toxin n=1 Tax=Pseudomonas edaphica TaxID=2006980 RepID=A0ABY2U0V7_9PSED|nr:type II toxin-antitoxin system RelE/ParE family toxin [Pseudomonas edaphica]TLG89457.1 type II toxin-antitoxin system RelE/ParE family toxin [Pseudomonas edaphica]